MSEEKQPVDIVSCYGIPTPVDIQRYKGCKWWHDETWMMEPEDRDAYAERIRGTASFALFAVGFAAGNLLRTLIGKPSKGVTER